MQQNLDQLSEKFSLPGLRFESGHGGLIKAVVQTDVAMGEVYLHGAHVTGYQPSGQAPVLWMSEKSLYESGKAIRGGVPICFPWFGPKADDPSAPGHGFARTQSWEFVAVNSSADGAVRITLQTSIENYALTYTITFGRILEMSLNVQLSESASGPATFEEALHTYLAISDITAVTIEGLESAAFIDKVDGATRKPATQQAIRFSGECDRVYLDTAATCTLRDPGFKRSIAVAKSDSRCSVVWNPWTEKSARMADFGDDEWTAMVCIETANVAEHAVTLQPGQSHAMTARIFVGSL